ncbi:hypothetical protein EUTSA_v10018766mg [Eutrema salsugineum]|uniref:Uncharacterized protein n=1 Tax=Eutrema salsugineum TaxID=72664 RepID=V4K9U1_EUTSA|nr:uncharacterized protein LOC18008955 [Eutrema salsugineum]XP_006390554.1 uncharacterized protein LOC18008955 [Eutrema salsugineum]ESQ27838.1 hypothetical protein EUTSA_v10018766mg [Eutrema salsugineum]ESQ27839.1 hypothetical protein EUTSA_v10018766mg [Eutrema salsugineum]ESQ27840.1 hypothetical protein EUTSA_v10018766mg [Eutrema salsugineum]
MTTVSGAVVSSFVAPPLRCTFSRHHPSLTKLSLQIPRAVWLRKQRGFSLAAAAAASELPSEATYDPELRLVFELATDSELYELENILFGPSYFSPLLKSIPNKGGSDRLMIGQDIEVRDGFIKALESRFLFLAADARSTLRGWRPSYRNVLLAVRDKLSIPCSSQLPTEDLEAEIFLYLVDNFSSEASGIFPGLWENSQASKVKGSLELGLSKWKVELLAALEVGAAEVQSMILKGGGMITFAKVYQLLAKKLSGKVFLEAANYQMRREMLKKGGQLAAINLESRAALLAAKHGFAGAASRYLGLRTAMQLLGPVMWGTLLADLVIQMLETDYARILRAIYAFAQIRITRTYRLPCK